MTRLTRPQQQVVDGLRAGHSLMWFGDNGPEMEGRCFWPQRGTVRAMLRKGVLQWKEYANDTQRECGICGLELTEEAKKEKP